SASRGVRSQPVAHERPGIDVAKIILRAQGIRRYGGNIRFRAGFVRETSADDSAFNTKAQKDLVCNSVAWFKIKKYTTLPATSTRHGIAQTHTYSERLVLLGDSASRSQNHKHQNSQSSFHS